jgi:geranylgeranyl diphosphate synthase type II
MIFDERMVYYTAMTDSMLDVLLSQAEAPPVLYQSMAYSLLDGGKRLRPVLCLAVCELLGGAAADAVKAACAMEMIHTYSLIHDDLPAMDNDDMRRGKPSSHRAFGEGNAILAGDGLLSLAFYVLSQTGNAKVMQCVSRGALDMVSGQSLDINGTHDAESLFDMHAKKTGALFRAAVLAGAYSAGNSETGRYLVPLTSFAEHFGLLFQITDDILDVTGDPALLGKSVGKDAQAEKATFVTLYGLEPAREEAAIAARSAVMALDQIEGDHDFLKELVGRTLTRSR